MILLLATMSTQRHNNYDQLIIHRKLADQSSLLSPRSTCYSCMHSLLDLSLLADHDTQFLSLYPIWQSKYPIP